MKKKPFCRFTLFLMETFPRYAILRCKNRALSYQACDQSQDARTRLMEAYMSFPKRRDDAILMHNEACEKHNKTRYSSPEKEAVIAIRIAAFRRYHLNDPKGAENYMANAFDLARRHGITSILEKIFQEFPQLLLI